jgi:nucleotide-binding universal stress UspA family protein
VVSTNPVEDQALRLLLKSQAISKSGSDLDFWVDLEHPLDEALVEAARHRAGPVVCICSRYRTTGVLRKKTVATPLPEAVLRESPAPVLVIGPETDVSRGLPLVELVVPYDGSASADRAVHLASEWAERLRLRVHLVALVVGDADPGPLTERSEAVLASLHARVPDASLEVVRVEQPAAALAALVAERFDAVLVLPETGGDVSSPLGPVAAESVARCERAVLVPPPGR